MGSYASPYPLREGSLVLWLSMDNSRVVRRGIVFDVTSEGVCVWWDNAGRRGMFSWRSVENLLLNVWKVEVF